MPINWVHAQAQYEHILSGNGVDIQWLERITSGSDAYSTGSLVTYGYGDATNYFLTGSIRVIVEHVRAEDVVVEAGFFLEDYEKIYFKSGETIDFWDQVIYPSGSGIRFLVLPLHNIVVDGADLAKYAVIRRLNPRNSSGN